MVLAVVVASLLSVFDQEMFRQEPYCLDIEGNQPQFVATPTTKKKTTKVKFSYHPSSGAVPRSPRNH